jgi:hypothetical protein
MSLSDLLTGSNNTANQIAQLMSGPTPTPALNQLQTGHRSAISLRSAAWDRRTRPTSAAKSLSGWTGR